MNQGRSPHSIETSWREILDLSVETGESPLYVVDAVTDGVRGTNAILALALVDAGRKDLAAPAIAVGGAVPLWLAGLWHLRPQGASPRTPTTITHYTAPDLATHLAALTTLDTRRSTFYRRPGNLPLWAQSEAMPEANPAAPERWETSPLARFSSTDGRDGWLAWAGVVTAIALLLIAALT